MCVCERERTRLHHVIVVCVLSSVASTTHSERTQGRRRGGMCKSVQVWVVYINSRCNIFACNFPQPPPSEIPYYTDIYTVCRAGWRGMWGSCTYFVGTHTLTHSIHKHTQITYIHKHVQTYRQCAHTHTHTHTHTIQTH